MFVTSIRVASQEHCLAFPPSTLQEVGAAAAVLMAKGSSRQPLAIMASKVRVRLQPCSLGR